MPGVFPGRNGPAQPAQPPAVWPRGTSWRRSRGPGSPCRRWGPPPRAIAPPRRCRPGAAAASKSWRLWGKNPSRRGIWGRGDGAFAVVPVHPSPAGGSLPRGMMSGRNHTFPTPGLENSFCSCLSLDSVSPQWTEEGVPGCRGPSWAPETLLVLLWLRTPCSSAAPPSSLPTLLTVALRGAGSAEEESGVGAGLPPVSVGTFTAALLPRSDLGSSRLRDPASRPRERHPHLLRFLLPQGWGVSQLGMDLGWRSAREEQTPDLAR